MAWTKSKTGSQILQLLKQNGIEVDPREAEHLKQQGFARICEFDRKSVNVRGNNSFGVIVCTRSLRGRKISCTQKRSAYKEERVVQSEG